MCEAPSLPRKNLTDGPLVDRDYPIAALTCDDITDAIGTDATSAAMLLAKAMLMLCCPLNRRMRREPDQNDFACRCTQR